MTIKPFLEFFDWLVPKFAKKKPLNIIIVEDDPSDAELLSTCLRYNGFPSTIAHNAEEAQALIARNSIDVIFVDMRLTYMAGWDLIPVIWHRSPKTLVVVTPGEISDIEKIPKFDGFFVCLKKPPTAELIGDMFKRFGIK